MNLLNVAILALFNLFFFSVALPSNHHTLVLNPILRLSSRRKRTLLFPNYGSIKITAGLSKGLIGNHPKGLSLSYEICSYFAGPTAVKDFLLNEMRQKKPKQEDIDKPNQNKHLKILHESVHSRYPNISDIYLSKQRLKTVNINHRSKNLHRLFERSSSNNEHVSPEMGNIRKNPLKIALVYLLGPYARCGILKTICKSKKFLLPSGYSMIQDIVRIVSRTLARDLTSGGKNSDFCKDKLYTDCDVE